jgi:hypothetical protein
VEKLTITRLRRGNTRHQALVDHIDNTVGLPRDIMATTAIVLGNHLADIAELVGLDRDSEDLVITPRVRELVSDPRVRQVLDEFKEVRRNAHHRR